MFDLDEIEKSWLESSKILTEEEIIEIFKLDGATIPQYNQEMEEWMKKTKVDIPELSPEEKLLRGIFKGQYDDSEFDNRVNRAKRLKKIKLDKYPIPQKKHLSLENRKIIIEGCMDMVFKASNEWYYILQEKVSKELLYYTCLEALIKCVKYVVHCGDPVFKMYVRESIRKNMIDKLARLEHISYKTCEEYLDNYRYKYYKIETFGYGDYSSLNLSLDYSKPEVPYDPIQLEIEMNNEKVYENYDEIASSIEFLKVYKEALDKLPVEEKMIMLLSYDKNGYSGLTYNEISNYTGLDEKNISKIKKRAIRKLRKDDGLKQYIN